jgi:hypothetical protein
MLDVNRVPNIKFNAAKVLQSMIPIVDSTVSSTLPGIKHVNIRVTLVVQNKILKKTIVLNYGALAAMAQYKKPSSLLNKYFLVLWYCLAGHGTLILTITVSDSSLIPGRSASQLRLGLLGRKIGQSI